MATFQGIGQTTNDTATAAANTAVVITYAAKSYGRHAIASITAAYSAAPTGGLIKVEDGAGTTVFQAQITAGGPTPLVFQFPMVMSENKACVITLAAGGGTVVGMLNVQHYAA